MFLKTSMELFCCCTLGYKYQCCDLETKVSWVYSSSFSQDLGRSRSRMF